MVRGLVGSEWQPSSWIISGRFHSKDYLPTYKSVVGIRGQVRSGQWPVPPPGEERGGGARKCQERWLSGNGCLAELRSLVKGRGYLLRKYTDAAGDSVP